MTHYWVAFEPWVQGSQVFSPQTWVHAKDPEDAERLARHKLRDQLRSEPVLQMTTCVPFSDEDYEKEMTRVRKFRKETQGWLYERLN